MTMEGSDYDINNSTNNNSHNPLTILYPFRQYGDSGTSLLATGDDNGGLRIWDERLGGGGGGGGGGCGSNKRPKGCVLEWNEHKDYVSGIEYSAYGSAGGKSGGNNTLLTTSADGSLGVYDLRMNKGAVADTTRTSDHQDDELLSLCVLKSGKKVVCGTQTGTLAIFSWGTWGDISDMFPGHPSSVDALLKVDENTLLTGSSDGLIRVVQLHPDKFLGILNEGADGRASGSSDDPDSHGAHGGYPVEQLKYNSNKDVVGSISHDNFVRLWDARILKDDNNDDDDDDDDEEEEEEESDEDNDDLKPSATVRAKAVSTATKKNNTNGKDNSDDEWEDMDNKNNDDDDSEVDSDDSGDSTPEPETVNDRRKKKLKTDNDKFFDDM
jgi:WD40 repeat protein